MSRGIRKVYLGLVGIGLIGTIVAGSYFFIGDGRAEIRKTKEFIGNLNDDGIIEDFKYGGKFKVEEVSLDSNGANESYRVSNDKYLVELNKNLDITSFTNNVSSNEITKRTEAEIIEIGKKCLGRISDKEYNFVEISNTKERDKTPYYSLKFNRVENGYPCYGMEVILNIDKGNGDLLGYINKIENLEIEKNEIKVSFKEAEEIATESLNKMNKNIQLNKETYLAYFKNKNNNLELVYVVNLISTNNKNEKEEYRYFISSNTAKIINFTRNIEVVNYKK